MTTDAHQQRMKKRRPASPRRCSECGVSLWPAESLGREVQPGLYQRLDICLACSVCGPPQRPEGAPTPARSSAWPPGADDFEEAVPPPTDSDYPEDLAEPEAQPTRPSGNVDFAEMASGPFWRTG
jgi:hypothetical protein